jgi:cobalt-zinc-cadmium efflux system membrane fusion protein
VRSARNERGLFFDSFIRQERALDLHDHTPTARGRAFMWGGILLGVLFVIIMYTNGFGLFGGHGHAPPESGAPVRQGDAIFIPEGSALRTRVTVEPALARPVSSQLITPGVVESDPAVTAAVLAPLTGRVEELPVELGQRVTRGQVVAVLDSPDLAQAYDDNAKAIDALALASKNLERQEQQSKIGVISDRDLDQARSDHTQAQAEANRTQARLVALGAAADPSGHPGRLIVRAPVTGSVTSLNVARGNMLNDATQPVMTIADLSTVWVTALVAEKDLDGVKVGQEARVTLTAYPGKVLQARVTSVSDVIEPDSRRDKVRIALPNADYALRPNMFATVTLLGPSASQVTVPTSALLMNNDRTSVFVATAPWTFKRRVVDMRLGEGTTAVILAGVSAGEQVVIRGGILLND